jgi:hypothetical protein
MGDFLILMAVAMYWVCVVGWLLAAAHVLWAKRRFSLRSLMLTMTLVAVHLGVVRCTR